MQDALKKALADAMREHIAKAREGSIFTDKGRMFLDATAMLYGAAVNSKGELIDADGKVMKEDNPDYQNIIRMAKKQARAESSIGRDIVGA